MGVRNYLIEGLSGAGKTTVAEELQRRMPYPRRPAIRLLRRSRDRRTRWIGRLLTARTTRWRGVAGIGSGRSNGSGRADRRPGSHPISFFCGGSRNRHHFIALFDKVFVLEADAAT